MIDKEVDDFRYLLKSCLGLPTKLTNQIIDSGVTSLGSFMSMSHNDILKIKRVWLKGLNDVKDAQVRVRSQESDFIECVEFRLDLLKNTKLPYLLAEVEAVKLRIEELEKILEQKY